ncbi:hypothetical protein BB560_005044 [Smittium megazygosporum]|uniref:Centromere protein J C-terminal domain-containing protein n=1 Tax=Smittium megazygosporum TaxID=133381 RepID=A0A2T9Z7P5_9FUNG|nr:hypothetical protein BB560_005044 [Smittium megazygosporum]
MIKKLEDLGLDVYYDEKMSGHGTLQFFLSNGDCLTGYPDGNIKHTKSDPKDSTIYLNNGDIIESGTTMKTFDTGIVQYEFMDGKKLIEHPDGTIESINSDGSITIDFSK